MANLLDPLVGSLFLLGESQELEDWFVVGAKFHRQVPLFIRFISIGTLWLSLQGYILSNIYT